MDFLLNRFLISQTLRRVLRKALLISSKIFGSENLLHETVPVVIDILGDTYPEMQQNYSQIQQIIRHEGDVLKSLSKNNSSKLTKILEENPPLDGNLVKRKQLTKSHLQYFSEDTSKIILSLPQKEYTNAVWKYSYEYNETIKEFVVPNLEAKIIAIENCEDGMFDVVLDKTNFYHKSGGQATDVGQIFNKNGVFSVENVISIDGVVIHRGVFLDGKFETNNLVELAVNGSHRTGNMRNHTATHLLHASVKNVTKSVTYQKSSSVMPNELKLDLGILGYKQDFSSINKIEKLVRLVKNTFE